MSRYLSCMLVPMSMLSAMEQEQKPELNKPAHSAPRSFFTPRLQGNNTPRAFPETTIVDGKEVEVEFYPGIRSFELTTYDKDGKPVTRIVTVFKNN